MAHLVQKGGQTRLLQRIGRSQTGAAPGVCGGGAGLRQPLPETFGPGARRLQPIGSPGGGLGQFEPRGRSTLALEQAHGADQVKGRKPGAAPPVKAV